MGTSTQWLAVEGATIDDVARHMGLVTVEAARAPQDAWEAFTVPKTGWVVFMQAMQHSGLVYEPAVLTDLSRRFRVVACDEEDHVMYSAACEWQDGRERWAVVHDWQEGAKHLEIRGEPPDGWQAVRDDILAQQAKADAQKEDVDLVYDIPLVIAQKIVGYRLLADENGDIGKLVTLASATSTSAPIASKPLASKQAASNPVARKPWWKLW
jgi:hypothetical protein